MIRQQTPTDQVSIAGVRLTVRRAGFTLLEILIVVTIGVLITGLLLAMVIKSRANAGQIRMRDDLQLIGTALTAYHDEFGDYPRFPDAGADLTSSKINTELVWLDSAKCRGSVLLCRALIGPGPAGTGTTANPGDDGADGPGFRIRRNGGGKVYGAYIDASKFKIGYQPSPYSAYPMAYPEILDSNGNAILYYPATPGNAASNLGYLDFGATLFAQAPPRFNGFDNQTHLDSTSGTVGYSSTSPFAILAANCGTQPYLLWTAGADGVFGMDTKNKTDDVTNFDLPAQYKK